MTSDEPSLRERQAQHLRTVILDAVLAALESMAGDEMSMSRIAKEAGVSLRTLYRHFPDRAALLEAAGDHLYASLEVPFAIAEPEDIAASFRVAARHLSARPKLARALVQSGAGRASRSRVRSRRTQAIAVALEQLTEQVEPTVASRAKAVITHLCSAAAWVEVADESALSDEQAQEAVGWAIDALVRSLRNEAGGARSQASGAQAPQKELS